MPQSSAIKPKILVVGAGAVGCYYGGRLAQAGAEVTLTCRSDHAVVAAHGVAVESVAGDFHFTPARVISQVDQYRDTPDFILVTTKALPTIDLATLLAPAVAPNSAIVVLQNGIDREPPLREAFPDNEIIGGLAFVCLERPAPGRVRHTAFGRVALGVFPHGLSPRVELLGELFTQAGVKCTLTGEITRERWRKLVWNAAFNPLSVLTGGATTAELLADPICHAAIDRIMTEVCQLATAAGYPLERAVVEKNLADTAAMAPYHTSMAQDFRAGRPLELEAILETPLARARTLGVDTPNLALLAGALRLLVRRNPPLDSSPSRSPA